METLSSLIPTDNLYRFLSIAGILIFSFCYFYPDYRTYQISQREITLTTEQEILTVKIKATSQMFKIHTEQLKLIAKDNSEEYEFLERVSKMNLGKLSDIDIKRYKSLLSSTSKKLNNSSLKVHDINKLIYSQAAISDSLDVNTLRYQMIHKLINNDVERLTKLDKIASVGQKVGLLMTIIGFVCWFFLIQLPQDILLRQQMSEINRNRK